MSDIIDRINKLLALAGSDNEEEAALAAERATRLMLKHAVTEDQLRNGAKHSGMKPIERTVQVCPPKYTCWHQYQLAAVIAHYLLCQTYYYGRARKVSSITSLGEVWDLDDTDYGPSGSWAA